MILKFIHRKIYTALHRTVLRKRIDIVKLLLNRKDIDVNAKDDILFEFLYNLSY